ncbi:hypothetical protein F0562_027824 [Nyssa sinensis]|uniref:starch synthase n=1 Tax=Nyssa sinensis TaxID=561372 RepID=A0A5J5B566_9ASTE|nr:hypothetical protein F0562_027824 [Nyssa sinensis]
MKKAEMVVNEEKDKEDPSLKLKMEMEANIQKQVLERLAEENFLKGIKLFNYPEVVKSNQDIESCQVYVPKEAYKMDFVFFNGKDVYDNNDKKDFRITMKGGMDVFEFDDFLLEEKRRELEKLAKDQAERERHANEQT